MQKNHERQEVEEEISELRLELAFTSALSNRQTDNRSSPRRITSAVLNLGDGHRLLLWMFYLTA